MALAIATVAPMPRARHAIADAATVGERRKPRAAVRTSVSSGLLMAAPASRAWRQQSDKRNPAHGWTLESHSGPAVEDAPVSEHSPYIRRPPVILTFYTS